MPLYCASLLKKVWGSFVKCLKKPSVLNRHCTMYLSVFKFIYIYFSFGGLKADSHLWFTINFVFCSSPGLMHWWITAFQSSSCGNSWVGRETASEFNKSTQACSFNVGLTRPQWTSYCLVNKFLKISEKVRVKKKKVRWGQDEAYGWRGELQSQLQVTQREHALPCNSWCP